MGAKIAITLRILHYIVMVYSYNFYSSFLFIIANVAG